MRPIVAIIGAIETAQSSAEVPHSITEAVAMAGGGKLGKSAIAQMLSDTSDKKSQEYKNQLRNVQRYYKAEQEKGGEGRVPSTKKGGKREALNRIFD